MFFVEADILLPETAKNGTTISDVNGFVDFLAVSLMLVILGPFSWTLHNWPGLACLCHPRQVA